MDEDDDAACGLLRMRWVHTLRGQEDPHGSSADESLSFRPHD
jgi:hypothetical protein